MLTVLFSWVIICGAALLFGKAVVDSVYKNRLEVMGRPDIYIVTGILFLNVYAQLFSLFYKVAGIACTILGAAGMVLFFVWMYRRFLRRKDIRLFPGCVGVRPAPWRIVAAVLCFMLALVWTT